MPISSSNPAAPLEASLAGPIQSTKRDLWRYLGPAFVASIAYIDPGNFATNLEGGTRFGYKLLWVLLWSNLMAILIQYLSAKLGIATGRTLPQNCRDQFSHRSTVMLWIAGEISALATDLAEFLGAALGFYLLFGPYFLHLGMTEKHVLLLAALASAVCVFAILALEVWGFRMLELGIMVFVFVIGVCYAIEVFLVHPNWGLVAFHTIVPTISKDSIYIAVGMLGATVMPHVVYLHSGLVQPRLHEQADGTNSHRLKVRFRRHQMRLEALDVFAAMNGAWLVNSAMIIVAAAAFAGTMNSSMTIEQAHQSLGPLLGPSAAALFGVALLCSGLSSSTVGTMAGQMILEGFMDVNFSIFLRRFLTILPAIVIIATGLDPLKILILSQVALSFTLPFALIPLLLLSGRPRLMREFTNNRIIQSLGWLTTAIILGLNALLLLQTFL